MCPVGIRAMNILQLKRHQLLALFVPMDKQRTSDEYPVIGMSHVDMVHSGHHFLVVDLMHIHRDILHVMLLQPIVLFDQDRTKDMQMNLHRADRNHDHMNDTSHYPYQGIYQADNVLRKFKCLLVNHCSLREI